MTQTWSSFPKLVILEIEPGTLQHPQCEPFGNRSRHICQCYKSERRSAFITPNMRLRVDKCGESLKMHIKLKHCNSYIYLIKKNKSYF